MPHKDVLTEDDWERINELPSWLRDDPDARAVVTCYAREAVRMVETARGVRDDLVPIRAAARGLEWWETLLHLGASGAEEEEARRTRVLGGLTLISGDAAGTEWEEALEALVGAGATYEEVGGYTIQITVPGDPSAAELVRLAALIRRFTPAHLDIALLSGEGFILDVSQLDQQPFHPS